MLALGMCVIASAYGNALGAQKHYEERHASRLADDLAELKATHSIDAYFLDGSAGYSPVTKHVAEEFPMIDRLVRLYLSAGDTFHTGMFLSFYISDVTYMERHEVENRPLIHAVLAEACQMVPTRQTSAYSLYVVGKTAAVMFPSERTFDCELADADH
jgi:hypothetical protein